MIPVTLRVSDNDVAIDLQTQIERVWKDGGFDEMDYSREPLPPLSLADEAWVRERVRQFRTV